jgi:hypothetical protein
LAVGSNPTWGVSEIKKINERNFRWIKNWKQDI